MPVFLVIRRTASLQGTSTCERVYSLTTLLRLPASWLSELLLIPQGPFCRLLLSGDLSNSCRAAYNTQNAQLPSTLFSSLIISRLLPHSLCSNLLFLLHSGHRLCHRVFAWAVLFKRTALRKWHLVHVFISMSPQGPFYLKLSPLCSNSPVPALLHRFSIVLPAPF